MKKNTSTSSVENEPVKPVQKKVAHNQSKCAKVIKRVGMSLCMISGCFGIVWLGHPYLVMLVVIIQIGCFRELVNVRFQPAKEKHAPLFRTIQWSMFWVAMFHTYGKEVLTLGLVHGVRQKMPPMLGNYFSYCFKYRSLVNFSAYIAIIITYVSTLRKNILRYQIGNAIWTAGILCLVVLQVKGIITLIFSGIFWFLLPCGLVVANDCFAYICGMLMGRRFIKATFLSISPNKTWEGFIGAIFCTTAFAWIFSDIISRFQWLICPQHELFSHKRLYCAPSDIFVRQSIPMGPDGYAFFTLAARPAQLHAIILACFASFVAPFGGFLASGIKRAYDIKDFGDLIPGHGGFMDRMDCQLLMLLCTYVYYQTFVPQTNAQVEDVLALLGDLTREGQERVYRELGVMLGFTP